MDKNAFPFVAPQEINIVSGPPLLVVLLNSGLLGVLSVQIYLYYLAFPKDRMYLKCLVYGIYFLEFVQTVLVIHALFRTFVTNFGDVQALDRVETLWLSVPVLTTIDTFFVQGFYAHRISILAQSKKVAGVILILSLIQLGGGLAVGVQAQRNKYYSVLNSPEIVVFANISVGIWTVGSALCDIIIAVCMTYHLSRYEPTVKETRIILKKIIRLTVETGTLTAVIGIVCFSIAILPNNPYSYKVPMAVIGKVYANSMLVLINSRMVLLGPEQTSLRVMLPLKFGTAPANGENIVSGDISPDSY
ncbi:hypothetical protein M413DRAFT_21943 [Hebeloma cylindrosporum]|uniref:DUF6534 domain-containing protein n=1 Tax=Hebeloma cylindrosporum TaxID=76867 RepID=A0A0C3CM89_HEBCY|nr:hypothetical protein M413DRAFT_21943 [Hebeloma cylindrosporum h7]